MKLTGTAARRAFFPMAIVALSITAGSAQEPEPRLWAKVPIEMDFVGADFDTYSIGYQYRWGGKNPQQPPGTADRAETSLTGSQG